MSVLRYGEVDRFLDKRDLCAAFRINTRALDRARATGRFPRPSIVDSGRPLWRLSAVRQWAKQQAAGPASTEGKGTR
jgi:predicted DNA-binding transcriptional regulator AlpA